MYECISLMYSTQSKCDSANYESDVRRICHDVIDDYHSKEIYISS